MIQDTKIDLKTGLKTTTKTTSKLRYFDHRLVVHLIQNRCFT